MSFRSIVPQGPANTRGSVIWTPDPAQPAAPEVKIPDQQIIEEALIEGHSNFSRYWKGERGRKPSRSEAMQALLTILAEKTGGSEEQVKRIYKQSGMYNPRRDDAYAGHDRQTGRRVTYLEMSARNAVTWWRSQQHDPDHPSDNDSSS